MKKHLMWPGLFLIALGGLLCFIWTFLPIGINDGEFGQMQSTGSLSHPEDFQWTSWSSEGVSDIFPISSPAFNDPALLHSKEIKKIASRLGKAEDSTCSFSIYELKVQADNGSIFTMPAYGPGSGTKMKWWIPLTLFFSGLFILGYWHYNPSKPAVSAHPDSTPAR